MKNVVSIFKATTILAIVLLSACLFAQPKDGLKLGLDKNWNVSSNDKLMLSVYDDDIKISIWEKSEVRIKGQLIIEGISNDDLNILSKAFAELMDKSSGTNIDTRLIESSKTSFLFGSKTDIKLYNGEKISVDKIKANYELWMPSTMSLNLSSKYNNIQVESLKGSVNFDLYNCDLTMGDFGDKSEFQAKYSTINAGKGKDAKFDIYDSKLTFDELNKVIITSKYSKFNSNSLNLLVLESYNDTYVIDNLKGIDIDAKYTSLKAKGTSNLGKFNLYDCNIEVGNFTKVEYDSKYSEFTASNIGEFAIKTSYNDTYSVSSLNDISCDDSKYNKFRLGSVNTSIKLGECYDSEINVQKLTPSFVSFNGDFKYGSVILNLDPSLNYRLISNTTYGQVNYPKERFKNRPLIYIEKDGKIELDCSTSADAKCEFNFTAFDLNFTIQ